jgi:hypothetical protein
MADIENDAPQTAEEESQQDNPEVTSNEEANEDLKAPEQGSEEGDAAQGEQFVTPQVLQGVIAAQQRTQKEELGKTITGLESKIEALTSSLESTAQISAEAQKEAEVSENSELIDLRRKTSDHESEIGTLRSKLEDAEKRESNFRFETAVIDALAKNGCMKPNHVFRMIAPDLEFDRERNKVYASVDGEFGKEELDVDSYVKRVVKEDTVPELFKASMRMGSPATGDKNNTGGERYMFTKEQVQNPEFYAKNADKIRDALDKGLVKGVAPTN